MTDFWVKYSNVLNAWRSWRFLRLFVVLWWSRKSAAIIVTVRSLLQRQSRRCPAGKLSRQEQEFVPNHSVMLSLPSLGIRRETIWQLYWVSASTTLSNSIQTAISVLKGRFTQKNSPSCHSKMVHPKKMLGFQTLG